MNLAKNGEIPNDAHCVHLAAFLDYKTLILVFKSKRLVSY